MSQAPPTYRPGPHVVALLAAATCWVLLASGGQVTTYRVGMAVPDWPSTFGANMFLYRFWEASVSWGVYIEHRHRLLGTAVGLAAIVLAGWLLAVERRPWPKALGVVALLAVIGQGLLGGNRVLFNSTTYAAIHGCAAQAVFALFVALTVLTGRGWSGPVEPRPDPDHLRRRALVTLALVAAQILVGANLRHFGAWLWLHAILALAVWGHAAALAGRVDRRRTLVPDLVPSARAMAVVVTAQVALGIAAWWLMRPFDGIPKRVTVLQALVRTGHVVNASLLVASVVVLALRSIRHLASAGRSGPDARPGPVSESIATSSKAPLEVLA